MKNASTIVQILLLIIGLSLLYFYVYPMFTKISEAQDQVYEFDIAIREARTMNSLLAQLISDVNSISSADRRALNTYLPQSIDPVTVLRDIEAYIDRSPVTFVSLDYADDEVLIEEQVDPEFGHAITEPRAGLVFNVQVLGQYQDIKNLIATFERNKYPLHANRIHLEREDGLFISAEFELIKYRFVSDSLNN